MAQSSIHIDTITTGSFLHNDRTIKPSYLIDDSSKNDCTSSSAEALKKFYDLKAEAEKNYIVRTGQKVQKKTVFLKEAIINLEEHHTIDDLQPIIQKLEGYGFTILQSSIHRDEGFVSGKRSGKNYHAHITLFNLNPATGKTVKFGKDYRQELSRLQTTTARTLKMERGGVSVHEEAEELNVPISKAKRRLDTHEYKRAMKLKDELEAQNLRMKTLLAVAAVTLEKSATPGSIKQIEAMKELSAEEYTRVAEKWVNVKDMGYSFRETQRQITELKALDTEQKKELHRLNTEINKIKADDELKLSKIKELEDRLSKMAETALQAQKMLEEYKDTTEKEIEVLRVSNEQKSKELETIEKLYGQIEGMIEESATIEDLKTIINAHEPYKPKGSNYKTAKERAQNAYRSKLGKLPLQVYHEQSISQNSVEELKEIFVTHENLEAINITIKC
ncbi:hypothetical protein [Sulfuricurvum sp.]|uniref:hypothetical protein n=1 Tax=Sulfuricurvum sp. TaxID=2025608 RepID=UPI002621B5A3|nr:hypothetical protein [Sulfuricurvum sp.]MDD3594817.1 hypothetical protein [Sulfuricurvum sp.]